MNFKLSSGMSMSDDGVIADSKPMHKSEREKNTIYVFCPNDIQEKITKSLSNFKCFIVFNDFNLNDLKHKVVLYYQHEKLSDKYKQYLLHATQSGAQVESILTYLERKHGYTEVELLYESYFIQGTPLTILSNRKSLITKRIIDCFISFILLTICLPILVIASFAIKLESKGPVLYRQSRVGIKNIEFDVYKLRSMRNDAEAKGIQWANKNDARVTVVGKFLRKTRIDELPQLINVFKGEMSLIGPRPERAFFVEQLEKEIPFYYFRHALKPGITGLAQVKYSYGSSLEDAIWKHKYDIHYIKNYSLWLDFKILLRTIKTVITGMGQ